MIGKAYTSILPFYDNVAHKMSFKRRPVLIVGQADRRDYVFLPVSSVTNKDNLDGDYDVRIDPADFPLMKLKNVSYVRTHKQSVIHVGELEKEIVDFRSEYPDKYLEIISKMEEFQEKLVTNAL